MDPSLLKALVLGPPRLTLAVAESVTCGRVQALVGSVSGASDFFLGGLTAYTLAQKVRHLGVDGAAAERVNGVSAEIAVQMARGVCAFFGSDLGLATTGYAERAPARGVAEPFAWWAAARRRAGGWDEAVGRIECPGLDRVAVQQAVAAAALEGLAGVLRKLRVDGAL